MATYNAPIVENQTLNISYSGAVQSIEIKKSGLYKLECWGGQGYIGYKAGYSVGYKEFKKGQILYVCVGQRGGFISRHGDKRHQNMGFNGGGTILGRETNTQGGGATHFALVNGLLQSIGYANRSNILIVAGGSGGGLNNSIRGGAGGGISGDEGGAGYNSDHPDRHAYPGAGGSQTSGGAGYGEMGDTGSPYNGTFGKGGGTGNADEVCTGGGGFFGGGAGGDGYHNIGAGGGGGSGWIDGVPTITYKGITYTPSTQKNVWGLSEFNSVDIFDTYAGPQNYDGKADITLIKKGTPLMYWSDREVDEMHYGDRDVDGAYYGDLEVN